MYVLLWNYKHSLKLYFFLPYRHCYCFESLELFLNGTLKNLKFRKKIMNVRFVNFQQLANGIYKDIIHLNMPALKLTILLLWDIFQANWRGFFRLSRRMSLQEGVAVFFPYVFRIIFITVVISLSLQFFSSLEIYLTVVVWSTLMFKCIMSV